VDWPTTYARHIPHVEETPILQWLAAADDGYFIGFIDAHDKGGPTHAHLLLWNEKD